MNRWVQINTNTCPYCRHNLNPHRIPKILFDEIIHPDGNIDDLNVENFHYFYYINEGSYSSEHILEFINKIKKAKEFKSTLLICENYNINAIGRSNYSHESTFGKLVEIGQISHFGTFPCYFQTEKGKQVCFNHLHQFTRIV